MFLTGRCSQLIQSGSEYLSPFIIENQLQKIEGIGLGTLLKISNKLILVVQADLKKEDIDKNVKGFLFDDIILINEIPRDPRHHSKIDYGKLKETIIKVL